MSETKLLLERLKRFNEWRKGDETLPQPDPEQVTKDIDKAIYLLRNHDLLAATFEKIANVVSTIDNQFGTTLTEDIFSTVIAKYGDFDFE